MGRTSRWAVVPVVALAVVQTAGPAHAAVSVSRAEVDGTSLRIDGTALPSRDIAVDGVVLGRSSSSGAFRIERDAYSAPADCTVDLTDGSGTVTPARLSGCTVSGSGPVDTTAPSVPTDLTATVVGSTVSLSWGASSDSTGVTGYRVLRGGTTVATTGSTSHADAGVPAGTHTYAVAAFDAAGNTSVPSGGVTVTVAAGEGLSFLTPERMPDAVLGQAYLGYVVASDPPGPSTFTFKLVSGKVPDGTRFVRNTLENRPEARVTGTPSRTGTFSFTVQVTDGTGAAARRTFTIVVAGS